MTASKPTNCLAVKQLGTCGPYDHGPVARKVDSAISNQIVIFFNCRRKALKNNDSKDIEVTKDKKIT